MNQNHKIHTDVVAFELDSEKRWKYISPDAGQLLKISVSELLGKSFFEFADPEINPEVKNIFLQPVDSFKAKSFVVHQSDLNGGSAFEVTVFQTHNEEDQSIEYFGKIICVSESVSSLKNISKEEIYKKVFESYSDAMFLFDSRNMRVVDMNPACETILGYPREELTNIPIYIFMNEEKDIIDRRVRAFVETRVWESTPLQFIRKDGAIIPAEISASNIDISDYSYIALTLRGHEEQKKSEHDIQQFEEHFRQFKDRINDVIYRYNVKENVYEFVSPSVLIQTGYTVEEFSSNPQEISQQTTYKDDFTLVLIQTGYTVEEFSSNPQEISQQTTYKDDFTLVQHRIRQHLTKGKNCGPLELQYRFIKKDGSIIWVSDHKSFEFDDAGNVERVNSIVRDITLQKAIEIQLRDSEEYFRMMFESSPDGLAIFDLPLTRFEINHQFTILFGYEQYELQDNPWQILERVPPNIVQARMDRLEREGTLEYNAIHFTKSGKVLYCDVKCSRFHTSKGPSYCAVVRDMTERRSLEFQLQQYSQELEKLVEQRTQELTYYSERLEQMVNERTAKLESANKELEQFAYTISHDLRVPRFCIEGFSDLLRDEASKNLSDDQREWVDIIISSTKRMNTLIADLLELARIGSVTGQSVEVHIKELLDDIKQEFSLTIESRNVDLSYADVFPIVFCDIQRLRQVLQNLISNAIKYNDKEEVKIDVKASERENEMEFVVTDNGFGIPEEKKEDIFILFKRLHSSDEIEGTGAGLAIAKKIVESLGGKIWVESTLGEGSEFHFTIPKIPA